MKLPRGRGISQKSAWHLGHRTGETWDDATELCAGEIEVDEAHIGGKESNKHTHRKLNAGRVTDCHDINTEKQTNYTRKPLGWCTLI